MSLLWRLVCHNMQLAFRLIVSWCAAKLIQQILFWTIQEIIYRDFFVVVPSFCCVWFWPIYINMCFVCVCVRLTTNMRLVVIHVSYKALNVCAVPNEIVGLNTDETTWTHWLTCRASAKCLSIKIATAFYANCDHSSRSIGHRTWLHMSSNYLNTVVCPEASLSLCLYVPPYTELHRIDASSLLLRIGDTRTSHKLIAS